MVCVGPWRGFRLLVRGPQKLSFRAFSSRRTQIFVESCVDFEVAHLSILMVWRLPYPEIPTLSLYNARVVANKFCMSCINSRPGFLQIAFAVNDAQHYSRFLFSIIIWSIYGCEGLREVGVEE